LDNHKHETVAGCSPAAFFLLACLDANLLALSSICGQASFGRFDRCLVSGPADFWEPDAPPVVVVLWCALNKL
jgi:hypothetical protein